MFQLISHEGGVGVYVLTTCELIDGEFLWLLSHKSQQELKVEKWVSVSWDYNAEIKRERGTIWREYSEVKTFAHYA